MTEQTATPEPASRPMPRLGRGIYWPDIIAEMARDEAKRCKERAVNLNGPAADSRKPAQPEPVTELTDHPSSVTSPAEIETPTDVELAELGARLDTADFAEALTGVVIEPVAPELPALAVLREFDELLAEANDRRPWWRILRRFR